MLAMEVIGIFDTAKAHQVVSLFLTFRGTAYRRPIATKTFVRAKTLTKRQARSRTLLKKECVGKCFLPTPNFLAWAPSALLQKLTADFNPKHMEQEVIMCVVTH